MPFDVNAARRPPSVNYLSMPLIEWMPAKAMCFGQVLGLNRIPPQCVLPDRDWFHVGRIHTEGNSTQVIDNQPCGNDSDEQFIGKSVGISSARLGDPKPPVSLMRTALPYPALIAKQDAFPESFLQGHIDTPPTTVYQVDRKG